MTHVSIIIPTYNRLSSLRECLKALSLQTEKDFEVFVINDGGVDATPICNLFPKLDLKYRSLAVSTGGVRARNAGIREARGRFIAFCDDDDLFLPTHLEQLLEVTSSADLVYSDAELVTFDLDKQGRKPLQRSLFAFECHLPLLEKTSFIIPSGSLYRRSLNNELGFLDESIVHHWDWDWFLRISRCHSVQRIPKATLLYGIDSGGDNASAHPTPLALARLQRFCDKHELGSLPYSNFWLMIKEEWLKPWQRPTERVWDGSRFWIDSAFRP